MTRDEELIEQKRWLEEVKWAEIQKQKSVTLKEMEPDALSLLAGECLANHGDPVLGELRARVEKQREKLYGPVREWRKKHERVCEEIRMLTGVVVKRGREQFEAERLKLPKIETEFLELMGGGFSMTPKAVLSTNEDGVGKAQSLIKRALTAIAKMEFESISSIEKFIEEKLAEIRAIDLTSKKKIIDALDYERARFLSSPL